MLVELLDRWDGDVPDTEPMKDAVLEYMIIEYGDIVESFDVEYNGRYDVPQFNSERGYWTTSAYGTVEITINAKSFFSDIEWDILNSDEFYKLWEDSETGKFEDINSDFEKLVNERKNDDKHIKS